MLRQAFGLAACLISLVTASSAFAFFDAEVEVGKRWYSMETSGDKASIASQEVDVSAHIDPIPLVPVSFGAKVEAGTLDTKDIKSSYGSSSVDTAAVFEAGLDIMAWIPMVPFITPYARLDIPVTGTMTLKGKVTDPTVAGGTADYAYTRSITGMNLGVGAKWSPLPLVRILVELQRGMETIKDDTMKYGGVTIPKDTKSYGLSSNAFLAGVEIGF